MWLQFSAYSDSNWASCLTTYPFTTGFCITLRTNPFSWWTKKQTIVSRSSTEAEYHAMASTTCELVWLKTLLFDLMVLHPKHIILYYDNQVALHITRNLVFHERTKHIKIDCHYVRENFHSNLMSIHISTQHQIVDIFTKALGKELFHHVVCKLGITDLLDPTWGRVLEVILGVNQDYLLLRCRTWISPCNYHLPYLAYPFTLFSLANFVYIQL